MKMRLSKVGVVIAKLALSIVLFAFGALIVDEVVGAFGSTYEGPPLAIAMISSLIPPVWSRTTIPWRITAGAVAFMAGILTYMAGRLLVMLFHAGVITNILDRP